MLIQSQQFGIHPTNNRAVQFVAGSEIRLKDGFESWRGSRFRARIEMMDVCSLTRDEIKTVFSEPFPDNLTNAGLPNFETTTNRSVMYPNPSDGVLNIETKNIKNIKIYGIDGKLLCSQKASMQDKLSIHPAIYQTGLYLVEVETENNIFRNKIIINKN